MPTIDLGYVIGPQGPQGATGATGATGAAGAAGPNQVTGSTSTTLNGVLQGNGSRVSALSSDSAPTANSNNLVRSGAVYNALQAKPNPNLLDNWYFVGGGSQQGGGQFPINHRAQITKTGQGAFIDRWFNTSIDTTSELQSDGLVVTASSNGAAYIQQDIEWESLRGQTVTYSALYSNSGTVGFATGTGTIPTAAGSSTITVVNFNPQVPNGAGCGLYVMASGALRAQIGITAGHTLKIIAVKLELGSMQTLARQVNNVWTIIDAPNREEQLLKCAISIVSPADSTANGLLPVGLVAGSGFPYLRFTTDEGNVYQWVITGSGTTQSPYKLAIQKYDGSTWSNLATFTAD